MFGVWTARDTTVVFPLTSKHHEASWCVRNKCWPWLGLINPWEIIFARPMINHHQCWKPPGNGGWKLCTCWLSMISHGSPDFRWYGQASATGDIKQDKETPARMGPSRFIVKVYISNFWILNSHVINSWELRNNAAFETNREHANWNCTFRTT